jgi:hypothetical protein
MNGAEKFLFHEHLPQILNEAALNHSKCPALTKQIKQWVISAGLNRVCVTSETWSERSEHGFALGAQAKAAPPLAVGGNTVVSDKLPGP